MHKTVAYFIKKIRVGSKWVSFPLLEMQENTVFRAKSLQLSLVKFA